MSTSLLLFTIVDTVSVLFMGDIMQHSPQLRSAHIAGTDTLAAVSYDYSSYFHHVQPFIDEADFTVANMEFCLGGPPYTGYPAFSAPESLPAEAARAGIDLFLCANNHICDRGRKGLDSTFVKYGRIGIPFTGIYRDSISETSENPFITEIRGVRIAFINFTYGTNGIRIPEPYIVNGMEPEKIKAAIKRAEDAGADIIIALPHWGEEYSTKASEKQKEWAGFLIGSGVDAVIGSHPHVVQEAGLPVIYSLGNFISNMSRRDTRLGLMYRLDIAVTSFGWSFLAGGEAIPVWCARAGEFEVEYTVLPIKEYLEREDEFRNKYIYQNMKDTYNRLKSLFEK